MKLEIDFDDMGTANPSVVLIAGDDRRRHVQRVVVPEEVAKHLKNAVDTISTHVGDYNGRV